MKTPVKTLLCLLLAGLLNSPTLTMAQDGLEKDLPGADSEIRRLLTTEGLTVNGSPILARALMLDLYRDNDFKPFWVRGSDIRELLELIEESPDHGLIPADYHFDALRQVLANRNRNASAQLTAEAEILLTESLVRYGYHRRFGKIKASSIDSNINFRREAFRNQPPAQVMREIFAAPSLQSFIDLAAPSGPYYRLVQHWLDRYRDIAAAGGWPVVAEGPALRKGDDDARVPAIRARLAVSEDLSAGTSMNPETFDADLAAGIRAFQQRHALDPDGIVGAQTLAALNVPVEHRIEQLRVSLERLRWVNQEAADTLVTVNIAGYQAFYISKGELVWSTRAMVGKSYRRTPVFRGDIAYMEFNPTWTIPPGILRNDTLPAIKRNPDYLASKNIRVIDRDGRHVDPATVDWSQYSRGIPYTLRQDPGPNNALGTVKFIFPNEHFVFLHDTPYRELFDQPERAFSSGCIRIEDPLRLAELLLDNPTRYSGEALQAIVDSRETQRINLRPKVPVVIMYLTAALDANGGIMFLNDVYQRDGAVLSALNGPVVIDPPDD
jgi:murein L,D-transpeptidase YcbB/YkuD